MSAPASITSPKPAAAAAAVENCLVSIRAIGRVVGLGSQNLIIKVEMRYLRSSEVDHRVETMSVDYAHLAEFLLAYAPFCDRIESAPLPFDPKAFRTFCLFFKEDTVFTWPKDGPHIVVATVNGAALSHDEDTPCFLCVW